jgi:mono/diheme cytochrome c family protein
MRHGFLPILLLCVLSHPSPQATGAERVDYMGSIKPVLAARCFACHGALKQKSSLRLDTVGFMKKGGDTGPAIVAGKSVESLLIDRITGANGATRMPPKSQGEPLKASEIALIRSWIDQGAVGPPDEKAEIDPRQHWAFKAPVRPALPRVKNQLWARNPIDAFIAARHEKAGLKPQMPASKPVLLRRVYLDLIGLPPTAEEIRAFLADNSPDAYEKVVDCLLRSPHYGERWGRHWMDIWRYSDWWGLGAEVRNSQKHIWHWRDWIIESLNADKGYDQMVREMLAADELYPTDPDRLRATGFLARQYFKFNRNSWLDEVVEHTSKSFLGLTINCARCHDHKYDPIAQQDYYRMRAFFEPYQLRTDMVPGQTDFEKDGIPRAFDCNLSAPTYLFERGDDKRPRKDQPLQPGLPRVLSFGELVILPVSLPPEAHSPELRSIVRSNYLKEAEGRIIAAQQALAVAKKTATETEKGSPKAEDARLAREVAEKVLAAAEAQKVAIEARADADRVRLVQPGKADAKERARIAARAEKQAALATAEESLARAELALARVAANKKADAQKKKTAAEKALAAARKALEKPGESYTPLRGSLKTLESNVESAASRNRPFPKTSTGRRSALARWLTDRRHPLTARVAVNHLWARHFGRPIVATVFDFGRKGAPPTHPELLDWLAVELRDNGWSMKHLHRLIVTSNTYRMSSSRSGAAPANLARDPENRLWWRREPVRMEAQVVRDALLHLSGDLDPALGGPSIPVNNASRRRSLYFVHSHNEHNRFLSVFDDASVLECYRRAESIVPQQALALENSRLALDAAEKIAKRLDTQPTDAAFIRAAFETVLGTPPTAGEQSACAAALKEWRDLASREKRPDDARSARVQLIQALVNHNDFITVR